MSPQFKAGELCYAWGNAAVIVHSVPEINSFSYCEHIIYVRWISHCGSSPQDLTITWDGNDCPLE